MATLPFSVPVTAVVKAPLGVALGLGLLFGAALAPAAELPRSQRVTGGPVAPQPQPPAGAGGAPPAPAEPMSEADFAALLKLSDLDQLNAGCLRAVQDDNPTRLRLLQTHILDLYPAPRTLPVFLANAEVLLTCHGPQAALQVLDRIGPGPGAGRVQWLLMQWRAANAALDHRRAALALHRLTAGSPTRLNALSLPIRRRDDGTVVSRSGVEVLAAHLEARGYAEAAGQLLLRQGAPGAPGAARIGRAVALLQALPVAEREAILETALNQAAAVGAWSLVSELLDAQAALPSDRALARRLRLSPRLDDAYGEWLLLRDNPSAAGRARQLEGRLRTPRAPGGHSAVKAPPAPAPPAPAAPAAPKPPPPPSPAPTTPSTP
ncbi:MAG: hypothetical protein ACK6BG_09660 [Cyanobacteriota bacterium]